MKTSTRSVLSLAALVLVLLGWSASTLAAPARSPATPVGETPTKAVRFGDLDLSTAVGAETLYTRIRSAARIVCREQPHAAVRDCRARAIDDTVNVIGSALLTSIHRSTLQRVERVVRR
jgi:UrcA family protein